MEEDDDLWVKMRHKHIADVIEYVDKSQSQLLVDGRGRLLELLRGITGSDEHGLQYRLDSVK